jgi:hypothetical protein
MVGGSVSLSEAFEQPVYEMKDIIARQRLKIKKSDALFIIDPFLTKTTLRENNPLKDRCITTSSWNLKFERNFCY